MPESLEQTILAAYDKFKPLDNKNKFAEYAKSLNEEYSKKLQKYNKACTAYVKKYANDFFRIWFARPLKGKPNIEEYQQKLLVPAILLLESHDIKTKDKKALVQAVSDCSFMYSPIPKKFLSNEPLYKNFMNTDDKGGLSKIMFQFLTETSGLFLEQTAPSKPIVFSDSFLNTSGISSELMRLSRKKREIGQKLHTFADLENLAKKLDDEYKTDQNRWYRWFIPGNYQELRELLSWAASILIDKSDNLPDIVKIIELVKGYTFMHEGFSQQSSEVMTVDLSLSGEKAQLEFPDTTEEMKALYVCAEDQCTSLQAKIDSGAKKQQSSSSSSHDAGNVYKNPGLQPPAPSTSHSSKPAVNPAPKVVVSAPSILISQEENDQLSEEVNSYFNCMS